MTAVQDDGSGSARFEERTHQPVKSADRVLDILELLSDRPEGMTISEVSAHLGFPRSSTHSLVHTLAQRGYVHFLPNGIGVRLGPRLVQLGMGVIEWLDLRMAARLPLEKLVATTHETAFLAVPEHGSLIYLDRFVDRDSDLRTDVRLGARRPAHCSSLGKSVLAALNDSSVEVFVERYGLPPTTKYSHTDLDSLVRDLVEVRRRGYAVDQQEAVLGVCCVGAPVRDHQDHLVAAVSVATTRERFKPGRFGPAVLGCAVEISQALGWRGQAASLYTYVLGTAEAIVGRGQRPVQVWEG